MPATVIAERIGWNGRDGAEGPGARTAAVVPAAGSGSTHRVRPGPAGAVRSVVPAAKIPLGAGQETITARAGDDRWSIRGCGGRVMIPSRTAPDLIAGHWQLIQAIGAVPRQLVWDNEGAVGCWRRGKPTLTASSTASAAAWASACTCSAPRDPEAKGITERNNGYFETSFLPGRSSAAAAKFTNDLSASVARRRRRLHYRLDSWLRDRRARWATDRAAMLGLPPAPPAVGWRARVRLPRDHYVRQDLQRLLRRPGRGRPVRRGERGPDLGDDHLRRDRGRPPRTLLGPAPNPHRPRPPGQGQQYVV